MRFLRLHIFYFTIFYFLYAHSNGSYQISKSPRWIQEVKFSDIPEKKSGNLHYLLIDEQINIETQEHYFHYAIKLLNSEGVQSVLPIIIDFAPEYQKLILHNIKKTRNNKGDFQNLNKNVKIVERENQAENYLMTGILSGIINIDDLKVNDIIEFDYSIKGFNPIYKNVYSEDFYLNSNVEIETLYKSVTYNRERKLNYSFIGTKVEPKVSEKRGFKTLEFQRNKVAPVVFEEQMPIWYLPFDIVTISEYKTWENVVNWATEIFESNKNFHRGELYNVYNQIKNNSKGGKYSFLLNAVKYVQDDIRYLSLANGINSHKPKDPSTTILKGFGDCKDKSLLLTELLKLDSIVAYPVLVNSILRKSIDKYIPNNHVFNHCIVKAKIDNNEFWFDPTITDQRGDLSFRYMPNYFLGLEIRKSNKGLNPIKLSNYTKIESNYFVDIINKPDSNILHIETAYYGYEADIIRNVFKKTTKENIQHYLLDYHSKSYPYIETKNEFTISDDERKNKIIIVEDYYISKIWFLENPKDSNSLTSQFYARKLNDAISLPESKIRNHPLWIENFPTIIEENLFINLPFVSDIKPYKTSNFNKFFNYSFEVQNNGGSQIELKYFYAPNKNEISQSEFKTYFGEIQKVKNKLAYPIKYYTLEQSKYGNWLPTVIMIIIFIFSIILCIQLNNRYNPVSEVEYPDFMPSFFYYIAIILLFGEVRNAITIFYSIRINQNYFISLINFDSSIVSLSKFFAHGIEFISSSFLFIFIIFTLIQFSNKRTGTITYLRACFLINFIVYIISNTLLVFENTYTLSEYVKIVLIGILIQVPIIIYLFSISIINPYFTTNKNSNTN